MALLQTPDVVFGTPCPDFDLPDPGGERFSLDGVRGPNGLVVAFICNHCPYVIAMADRLAADLETLRTEGIGGVCIMSNDWRAYPQDAPDRMGTFAAQHGLTAPYLVDEKQAVAQAFGAVCTPDLFGYGPGMKLGYRGRLDDIGMRGGDVNARRPELIEAMRALAAGGKVEDQTPSMGCSIKWR